MIDFHGKAGARRGGKSVLRATRFLLAEERVPGAPMGDCIENMETASRTLKGGREAEGERERKPLGSVCGHKNVVSAFLCPFFNEDERPLVPSCFQVV